jgi:hypothetical protein
MYGKDGSSMTEPVAVPAQSSCRFGKGTKQELLICIKDYPNVSREHEKRVFAIIGENLKQNDVRKSGKDLRKAKPQITAINSEY